MESKKIIIGIAAVALLSAMVGNAYACLGPGLSPGFWKHNVGVYLGLANGSYSDPVYYPGNTPVVTKDTMGTWLSQWSNAFLQSKYDDLNFKGGGAAGDALRVAAANFFNNAADLLPYAG